MKKIALIKPPSTYASWYQMPTQGLVALKKHLSNSGIEVRIFDALFHQWDINILEDKVYEFKPDLVGISAMTHEIIRASSIAENIKKRFPIPIAIGGCHITALPEKTLIEFPVFDYGVFGEGEKTFTELINFIRGNSNISLCDINGLVYRNSSSIIINKPRASLTEEELNALYPPDLDDYYPIKKNALSGKNQYYTIFSSRGCPYNCAFCMQVLGHKVRHLSPENIVDEIKHAISTYGAHTINFSDEIFLFNNEITRTTLKMLIESGISKHIRWSGLTRANMVNNEIVSLAKKSGCYRLEMGIESGDDDILQSINKNITVRQIREAVAIIKKHGLDISAYFIIGHPHETPDKVYKTIKLATELNPTTIAIGMMCPYPGTKIYQMAKNSEGGYKLLSEDWSKYDKYGADALECEGLSPSKIKKMQLMAYMYFYIKNLRFIDLLFFLTEKRHALFHFAKRRLGLVS